MKKVQYLYKKIIAAGLIISMSLSPVCTTSRAEQAIDQIPDLTADQLAPLVQESFDNYKTHDAVCYTLESSDGWYFIGYDSKNKTGVISYDNSDNGTYRKGGFDYEENNWFDYNSRVVYEMEWGADNKPVYYMSLVDKKSVKTSIEENFSDFLTTKEKAFPVASEYVYAGKILVYTPNNEKHLCYCLEIPYSDESLYLTDENYLPTALYIGVDDKQIYRIDEERIGNYYMDYSIREYHTYFSYPEKISIPKTVKKNSEINPDLEEIKGGVSYSPSREDNSFMVYSYDYDAKKKNIKILDKITVLGKTEKVKYIDYRAFVWAKKLKSVTFGKNIKEVFFQAFMGCEKLKKVKMNKGLKYINDAVFRDCPSLKSLTFPKSVKSIGKNAFKGCKKLKTIVVKNKKLRNYLKSSKGRKMTALPAGVIVK